jgi:hypothetical protein
MRGVLCLNVLDQNCTFVMTPKASDTGICISQPRIGQHSTEPRDPVRSNIIIFVTLKSDPRPVEVGHPIVPRGQTCTIYITSHLRQFTSSQLHSFISRALPLSNQHPSALPPQHISQAFSELILSNSLVNAFPTPTRHVSLYTQRKP